MATMTTTLLLSGGGDFTDPWHPFEQTSARIAGLLEDCGHGVRISTAVANSLSALARESTLPDLVVLNAGNGELPTPGDVDALAGLRSYLDAGLPLLVFHAASTAFPGLDTWDEQLGGRWIPGSSVHPPWGHSVIEVATDAHPLTIGVPGFSLQDERYSFLRVNPDVLPVAWHRYENVRHPLVWTHRAGAARVVYDALGHDENSFDSPEHRQLIRNAVNWLTAGTHA
jgi:uncharacterized protein